MLHMVCSSLLRCLRDECGATAIEYALIGSLISIVIIGAVTNIGENMQTLYYDRVGDAFD